MTDVIVFALIFLAIWAGANFIVRGRWPFRRERERGGFEVRHDRDFGAHVVETPPRNVWRWNW